MQHLGEGAVGLGALEGQVVGRDPVGRDVDVAQLDGAAGGRALPHPGPVVGDAYAGRAALDPGDVQRSGARRGERVLARQHRDPVGEERAGAVALGSGEGPPAAAGGGQGGADVAHVPGADLRLRVAEPLAGQHLAEEEVLLLGRALVAQRVDVDEVAVRHLGHAGVAGGEDAEDLDERPDGQAGATVARRHGDREQPRRRESLDLGLRQDPVAVAHGGRRRRGRRRSRGRPRSPRRRRGRGRVRRA